MLLMHGQFERLDEHLWWKLVKHLLKCCDFTIDIFNLNQMLKLINMKILVQL